MTIPYQPSVLVTANPGRYEDRFWSKVEMSDAAQCWEWKAFRNPGGYGMFRIHGKMELAHRVAWRLRVGPFTASDQVLHHCDNPPCVNPSHLFLGDNADNVRDKVTKGRSSFPQPKKRGEWHPLAKLTQRQVDEIRARSTGTHGEGRRLAIEYDVSPATISNILKGKVWRGE